MEGRWEGREGGKGKRRQKEKEIRGEGWEEREGGKGKRKQEKREKKTRGEKGEREGKEKVNRMRERVLKE